MRLSSSTDRPAPIPLRAPDTCTVTEEALDLRPSLSPFASSGGVAAAPGLSCVDAGALVGSLGLDAAWAEAEACVAEANEAAEERSVGLGAVCAGRSGKSIASTSSSIWPRSLSPPSPPPRSSADVSFARGMLLPPALLTDIAEGERGGGESAARSESELRRPDGSHSAQTPPLPLHASIMSSLDARREERPALLGRREAS